MNSATWRRRIVTQLRRQARNTGPLVSIKLCRSIENM
jgi:hypothetical protein